MKKKIKRFGIVIVSLFFVCTGMRIGECFFANPHVLYETRIPDGTKIRIYWTPPKFFDSWLKRGYFSYNMNNGKLQSLQIESASFFSKYNFISREEEDGPGTLTVYEITQGLAWVFTPEKGWSGGNY